MGKKITLLLILLLPLLSAAGETLRGNSVLGGVKDDVASCFVADDVMMSSMRTVSLGVKTEKAVSLAPFGERGEELVRSVVVSGSLRKSGPDYVVRIILKDRKGGERLILESYEELTSGCADELTFSGYGEETLLMDGVDADSIVVCVRDAEVRLDEVGYSVEPVSQVGVTAAGNRKRQVESIVERINRYNVANRKLWRAAVTDVSLLDYGTKKRVVGIADGASSLGIEYYGGGIFEMGSHAGMARSRKYKTINNDYTDTLYVDHFSWRNRHKTDWLTHHKNQGASKQCTSYATVGCLEALINLYYNQKLDLNFSEQYMIDRCGNPGALGYLQSLRELKEYGVFDSLSYPYGCEMKEQFDYEYMAKIRGYVNLEDSVVKENLKFDKDYWRLVKKSIMEEGPLLSGYRESPGSDGGHAMVLYGWGTIRQGDVISFSDIYNIQTFPDHIVIDENNEYIGQTYWLFKSTYEQGSYLPRDYKLLINPSMMMPGPFVLKGPIKLVYASGEKIAVCCTDNDGDGYYNWGIGPKPPHCPTGVWDKPDGDDTDSEVGPLDDYGHLLPTNPDLLDTTYIDEYRLDEDTVHIYQHTVVVEDGYWEIYAPVIFHNGAKLIVRSGGGVYTKYKLTDVDLYLDDGSIFIEELNNIKNISANRNKVPVGYYNLYGQKLDKPRKGMNIIRYNDGTARKVLK